MEAERKEHGVLNRNQIKWIAIIAMLIDHIAWAFVPTASLPGQIMHFIGRLTGPTMAFFVAEGYAYTSNIKKYLLRMGIFAVISWMPFVYFETGKLPITFSGGNLHIEPYTGVIYTLFLGLVAIYLWDRARWPKWCKVLGVIGLCVIALCGDWLFLNVLWCLFLYQYRNKPKQKWIAFSAVGALSCIPLMFGDPWWLNLFNIGIYMVPFLIQFGYNGRPGSKNVVNKWFFYIFYPLHLLLLGWLRWGV